MLIHKSYRICCTSWLAVRLGPWNNTALNPFESGIRFGGCWSWICWKGAECCVYLNSLDLHFVYGLVGPKGASNELQSKLTFSFRATKARYIFFVNPAFLLQPDNLWWVFWSIQMGGGRSLLSQADLLLEAANGHSVFGNHQDIAAVHLTKVKPVQRVVEYQITMATRYPGTIQRNQEHLGCPE